jgi:hypothetical protein
MGEWLNPNGAAGYNWVDSCPYIIDAGFLVENPEGTAILSFPGIFIGNRRVEKAQGARAGQETRSAVAREISAGTRLSAAEDGQA